MKRHQLELRVTRMPVSGPSFEYTDRVIMPSTWPDSKAVKEYLDQKNGDYIADNGEKDADLYTATVTGRWAVV